jgi:thioredoxin-related protein
MRTIAAILLTLSSIGLLSADRIPALERARSEAKEQNKLILLHFSGSDWCLPCIRMEKEVFEKESFNKYASGNLVMLNADFPRQKKNIQKDKVADNEALAEVYDKQGHFPYTVLLDASGKVLMTWDGYKDNKPEDLIREIKAIKGGN